MTNALPKRAVQDRECLIEEVVQTYLARIAEEEALDPVTVRFDGESYFLQDGSHRVEAARRSGFSEIDAEVLPGTLQEMEAEFHEMTNTALLLLGIAVANPGDGTATNVVLGGGVAPEVLPVQRYMLIPERSDPSFRSLGGLRQRCTLNPLSTAMFALGFHFATSAGAMRIIFRWLQKSLEPKESTCVAGGVGLERMVSKHRPQF
jgi:hypothetical protein